MLQKSQPQRGAIDEAKLTINTPPPNISITPTIYPEHPTGPVIVQNFVTINIQSADFTPI